MRRWVNVAALTTAERTTGCRNRTPSVPIVTRPALSIAAASGAGRSSRCAAARICAHEAPSAHAATSNSSCAPAGSRRTWWRKAASSPALSGSGSGSGRRPASSSADRFATISSNASGLPPAYRSRRSRTSRATVPPARQLAHPGRVEAAHVQPRPRVRGEPARRLVPGSDQQADRVAREPARDEPQGVRALVVEPLHVVDQADQAGAAGRLGEDRQYRQRDEERIVAGGRPEPQRAAQRGRLLVGQAGELPEYRTQQLVHAAPGEPGLELHSGRTQYRQPTGRAGRVLQQRGLADPRGPVSKRMQPCPTRTWSSAPVTRRHSASRPTSMGVRVTVGHVPLGAAVR